MPEPTDASIADRLRVWADDLADQVPPHRAGTPTAATARRRLPLRLVAAIVVGVALVGTVVAIGMAGDADDSVVAAGDAVDVAYERQEVTQDASGLTCPGGVDRSGRFDDAVVETWGDTEALRFRTRVTYPDGSTTDAIVHGLPWYPDSTWTRGAPALAEYQCDGYGGLSLPPIGDGVSMLNPMVDRPTGADLPPGQVPVGGDPAVPLVVGYRELGILQPGPVTDALGRPAELWVQQVDGTYFGGPPEHPTGAIHQVTEWFVEPDTGLVLEHRSENTQEGAGTVTTATLVTETGRRVVPESHFDTDGYEEQPGSPLADIGNGSPTTTAAGAADGAAGDRCPALPDGPRVAGYTLGHVPAGYRAGTEVETTPPSTPGDVVGEAEERRRELTLSGPSGRRIDVVALDSNDPAEAAAEEHRTDARSLISLTTCRVAAPGDRPSELTATISEDDSGRIVVSSQEWEHGAFAVVGTGGASRAEVRAVAEGLRLARAR